MDNRKDMISVLRRVISYFRAMEEETKPEERDELWNRIRTDIRAKETRRRNIRLWSPLIAAASLIGCVWLGYSLYESNRCGIQEIAMQLMENSTAHTEIQLITQPGESILVEDRSTVTYSADGKIHLNEKQVANHKKPEATSTDETGNTNQPETEKQYDQIIVPKGKFSRLVLADGSTLYLNSDTKVVYPKQFDKDKREIFVDGEIYIDVRKNEKVPFFVRTADFDV